MGSLITGAGDLWVGPGRAFRDEPLDGTLIVLHACGQAQPRVLLTYTPATQTGPTPYACRNWIEQAFRRMKTVGWKWHKTRRLDPVRVGRHWLVLALATLLAVAYDTRREEAEARHLAPGPHPGYDRVALGLAPQAPGRPGFWLSGTATVPVPAHPDERGAAALSGRREPQSEMAGTGGEQGFIPPLGPLEFAPHASGPTQLV